MSELTDRHEAIIREHHATVQQLLEKVRGHNSALVQAQTRATASDEAAAASATKHGEALHYLVEITKLLAGEIEALG